MTFNVLATDKVSTAGLAPLRWDDRFVITLIDDSSTEDFISALAGAHGLIVRSATKVGAEMMDQAPNLRAIGRAGVGVDNIDVDAATERGIAVFNAPGGNTIAAAELTMALMLSLVRRVTEADRSMRKGKWDRSKFKGVELKGRTLGLIGAGRIGSEVATRAMAFGMDVIVYDPYLDQDRAEELGVELVDLNHVIESADVITLHVPLNEETRGMIDASVLARMKDDVFLINASRGGVIDEHALYEALQAGTIGGAALDVYEHEPLPSDSPLRKAPRLVHTPHLGASTKEAQVGVATEVSEALILALAEGDVSEALNADALG